MLCTLAIRADADDLHAQFSIAVEIYRDAVAAAIRDNPNATNISNINRELDRNINNAARQLGLSASGNNRGNTGGEIVDDRDQSAAAVRARQRDCEASGGTWESVRATAGATNRCNCGDGLMTATRSRTFNVPLTCRPQTAEALAEADQRYAEARAREMSAANRALAAASVGAIGMGMTDMMAGRAQQQVDENRAREISVIEQSLNCGVQGNQRIGSGQSGNAPMMPRNVVEMAEEYATLAARVRSIREQLGIPLGIEGEALLDMGRAYDVVAAQEFVFTGGFSTAAERVASGDAAARAQRGQTMALVGVGAAIVGDIALNVINDGRLGRGDVARYMPTRPEMAPAAAEPDTGPQQICAPDAQESRTRDGVTETRTCSGDGRRWSGWIPPGAGLLCTPNAIEPCAEGEPEGIRQCAADGRSWSACVSTLTDGGNDDGSEDEGDGDGNGDTERQDTPAPATTSSCTGYERIAHSGPQGRNAGIRACPANMMPAGATRANQWCDEAVGRWRGACNALACDNNHTHDPRNFRCVERVPEETVTFGEMEVLGCRPGDPNCCAPGTSDTRPGQMPNSRQVRICNDNRSWNAWQTECNPGHRPVNRMCIPCIVGQPCPSGMLEGPARG